jgi:hypothetical protein
MLAGQAVPPPLQPRAKGLASRLGAREFVLPRGASTRRRGWWRSTRRPWAPGQGQRSSAQLSRDLSSTKPSETHRLRAAPLLPATQGSNSVQPRAISACQLQRINERPKPRPRARGSKARASMLLPQDLRLRSCLAQRDRTRSAHQGSSSATPCMARGRPQPAHDQRCCSRTEPQRRRPASASGHPSVQRHPAWPGRRSTGESSTKTRSPVRAVANPCVSGPSSWRLPRCAS